MKSDAIVSNVVYLKPRESFGAFLIDLVLRTYLALGMFATVLLATAIVAAPFVAAAWAVSKFISISISLR